MSTPTITLPAGFVADESVKFPKRSAIAKNLVRLGEGEYTLVVGKYADPEYTNNIPAVDAVFFSLNYSVEDVVSAQTEYLRSTVAKNTVDKYGRHYHVGADSTLLSGIYRIPYNDIRKTERVITHLERDTDEVTSEVESSYGYGEEARSNSPVSSLVESAQENRAYVQAREKREADIAYLRSQERTDTDKVVAFFQDWLTTRESEVTIQRDDVTRWSSHSDEADKFKALMVNTMVNRLVVATLECVKQTTLETIPFGGRNGEARLLTLDEAVAHAVLAFADRGHMDDPTTPFFRSALKEFQSLLRTAQYRF